MCLLIITSAINIEKKNVPPQTKLTEIQSRLNQYLQSIDFAINNYRSLSAIIFCDSTNYDISSSELSSKADSKGIKLEVLKFTGSYENVVEKGKGYGEGEIMEYIYKKSCLLKDYESFFKLTGRLKVLNFDKVVKSTRKLNNFIFYPRELYNPYHDMVSTVFYQAEKKFFYSNLINAYFNVNDNENEYLEKVYYDGLESQKKKVGTFKVFPIISGQSGSTGAMYDLSTRSLIYEKFITFFGIHNINQSFISKGVRKMVVLLKKIVT